MNFYFDAAKTLDKLDAKQGSIKGVINSLPEKDRKRAAALVIETLKFKQVLTDVIKASELLKHEKRHITSHNLSLLLVHDLLFSRGIQAGDGPIKQAVLRHKTRLHAELTKVKIKRGAKDLSELASAGDPRAGQIPRYVRVNSLEWTMEKALEYFESKGFDQFGDPLNSKQAFRVDEHIPFLFKFHPSAQFQDETCLTSGKIILQDKASCFPAEVLHPPTSDDVEVIDATAAPGNKTTHLSAIMGNRGKLYAFERDRKRFATLQKMVKKARCTNVVPTNVDFLTVDPQDSKYSKVSHILLDPSCSGTGIVNRLDHLLDAEDENDDDSINERLQKLASFQIKMIKHAMKFPGVRKIVYSTCSIHATENEEVVCQALESEEAKNAGFTLAPRELVLPTWHRRGLPEKMGGKNDGDCVIRCNPGEDHTNGFFVSCFVRQENTGTSGRTREARIAKGDAASKGKRLLELGEDESNRQSKKKRKKKKLSKSE